MPYKDPAERRAAQRRSDARHRDARKAYQQFYNKTHKAKINARRRRNRKRPEVRARENELRRKGIEKINARRRELRRIFPEKTRANDKRWRDNTREATNARRRARRAENPLIHREEQRRQRAKYPERMQARFRRWYLSNLSAHLPRQRRYRQAHPDLPRIWGGRRRARKLALPDTFTQADHDFMMAYWQHACAICGNQEGLWWTLAADHVIALTSPDCPGTVATNLIPLCHGTGGCNNSKHNKALVPWLMAKYPPAKARRILKAIETYFAVVRTRQAGAAAD